MDEFIYQCMIRQLLKYKKQGRTDLIKRFFKRRECKRDVHNKIVNDCRIQWEKGNRGEEGKWL